MEGKVYWLITAPKTRDDTYITLTKKTTEENDLSANYKFQIPDLKVGTLDVLVALSDELVKMDTNVEHITRKIANQLFDLLENEPNKNEALTVNNSTIDSYLTFFRWDEAKFPYTQPMKQLSENIVSNVSKIDEELKNKSGEYTNITRTIQSESRSIGGNLVTRDLSDIVQEKDIIQSEFMETILVVTPKSLTKTFLTSYEKFNQYVVPRSAEILCADNDYELYKVLVMKKFADDFKNKCRENKFIIREFKYDANRSASKDLKKLEEQKAQLKKNLIRWCKVNFGEVFQSWIHLKAIRAFVESVLRYGLPTNFQAMLLLPNKGKQKKLRQVLQELYGHLGRRGIFDEKGKTEGEEDFFPYIYLEVNLDLKNKQL